VSIQVIILLNLSPPSLSWKHRCLRRHVFWCSHVVYWFSRSHHSNDRCVYQGQTL
jgi:hypothetical protein